MRKRLLPAGAALLALAGALWACGAQPAATVSATPSETPLPTGTPLPTPTPTPSAADHFARGEAAFFNGDWDAALASFATASSGESEVAARAQLQSAAVLFEAGRLDEARSALDFFLVAHPEGPDAARAYLLRARLRRAQADPFGAVDDYDAYLAMGPGVIDAYVHEWAGDVLWNAGQAGPAAARYQTAAGLARLGDATAVRFKAGRALLDAEDPDAALAIFDSLYQGTIDPSVRAAANWYAGQAFEAKGEDGAAYARYLESVNNYPEAQETYLGLVELVNADVPVDDFQRGRIDLNVGVYEPAVAAFTRVIESSPSSTAYYLRGLSRRGAGDPVGAIEDLRQVFAVYSGAPEQDEAWLEAAEIAWFDLGDPRQAVSLYLQFADTLPENPSAPEALFSAGRAAELSGDLPGAVDVFDRLAESYPASQLGSAGALRAGLNRYRLGDLIASAESFRRAGEIAQDSGDRAAAAFWMGKALEAQGASNEAAAAWSSAATSDPTGYYSVRAEEKLDGLGPFESTGVPMFPGDLSEARLEAEVWLRSTFPITGPDPLNELDDTLEADPRMVRGLELLSAGLSDEARAELESLRQDYRGDAEATYRLLHRFLDLGLYDLVIRSSRQVLDLAGLDDAGTLTAPRYFNLLRFGPYFGDLILPAALAEELDPLFLLSVVRQESLFQGSATSSASARGLMQVIPTTGAQIASELGWPPGYTEADLHRPIVSVRFGSHYLATQRDHFGGDLMTALAAYNGGPGNAIVWQERAGGDPDLLMEVIGFQETRTYLRTITEVFAIYQDLYGPSS